MGNVTTVHDLYVRVSMGGVTTVNNLTAIIIDYISRCYHAPSAVTTQFASADGQTTNKRNDFIMETWKCPVDF